MLFHVTFELFHDVLYKEHNILFLNCMPRIIIPFYLPVAVLAQAVKQLYNTRRLLFFFCRSPNWALQGATRKQKEERFDLRSLYLWSKGQCLTLATAFQVQCSVMWLLLGGNTDST